MAIFEEIDTQVRQMLADAGLTHPGKDPALIVISLASARELRSDPRWREAINHASLGADQDVQIYLGTRIFEDSEAADPWLVLTTSQAETYLRQQDRLGRPKAAELRAFFIERLRGDTR